jgi:hypothetical protein
VLSRDDRVGLGAAGTGLMLVCLMAAIVSAWLARVPLPEEANRIVPTGSFVAYNGEGDDPLVLRRGDGRHELVSLDLNWRPLARLGLPSWQTAGSGIGLPGTRDPASLFVLGCSWVDEICDDVTLVGQVNAGDISLMEVAVDGGWQRFITRAPGFIKHLPRHVRLGDVRWLDADRRVVWALDRNGDGRIAPVLPGAMRPNPHSRYAGQ